MRLLLISVLLASVFAAADALGSASSFDGAHPHSLFQWNGNTSMGKACSPEPMTGVKQCLALYYIIYGYNISHMPDWTEFNSKIYSIMKKEGKAGVQYVCKISEMLNACLANVEGASTCQNVQSYKAILGVSMEDAEGHLFLNVKLGYWGANEKVYEDNFECIEQIDFRYNPQIAFCRGVADSLIHRGTDRCGAMSFIVICYTNVYKDACNAGIDRYACEWLEAFAYADDFQDCKGKLTDCQIPFGKHYAAKQQRHPSKSVTKLNDAFRYNVY